MSLTYGFFNSADGDRVYDASDFSGIFDGIINDGIFMSIGDCFNVTPGNDLAVKVGTGKAWFNGKYTINDTILSLSLEDADRNLNRIDLVILEVNETDSVRACDIKILTGEPAVTPVRPTVSNSSYIHQYMLAEVYVTARATSLSQANITNHIGTTEAPYVTGILETIDAEQLVAQWKSQWTNWLNATDTWMQNKETEIEAWEDDFETDATTWMTGQQTAFAAWFENIRGQLDEDQAGHLQNEVDDLNSELTTTSTTLTNQILDLRSFSEMQAVTTVFNSDGSISQTFTWGTATTVFNADGTITVTVVDTARTKTLTKTITITSGQITETVVES